MGGGSNRGSPSANDLTADDAAAVTERSLHFQIWLLQSISGSKCSKRNCEPGVSVRKQGEKGEKE